MPARAAATACAACRWFGVAIETMSTSETASRILPPGFRLGEPFELPYDLETIRCRVGAVHLHQRPTTVDNK